MEDIWDIFSTSTHFSGLKKEEEEERIGSKSSPHCSECGSEDIVLDHGHQLCLNCGTDLGPVLEGDDGSLFHDTDKSGNTHRLSGNTNSLLQKSSLGTSIGGGSYRFRSMMRYHKYNSMPYKERSQWKIFKKIKTACDTIHLPKCISDESQRLYKTISETCNARGNHRLGLIASCVFYACKYEGVPRTSKEVAKLFNISFQDLTKAMKKFREIVGSKKDQSAISTALDYIPRFCQQIGFSIKEQYIVECIIAKCYILSVLPECTSVSLGATILYIVNELIIKNNDITKQKISKVCRVSEVTILKCYRKIQQQKQLHIILPNEFVSSCCDA